MLPRSLHTVLCRFHFGFRDLTFFHIDGKRNSYCVPLSSGRWNQLQQFRGNLSTPQILTPGPSMKLQFSSESLFFFSMEVSSCQLQLSLSLMSLFRSWSVHVKSLSGAITSCHVVIFLCCRCWRWGEKVHLGKHTHKKEWVQLSKHSYWIRAHTHTLIQKRRICKHRQEVNAVSTSTSYGFLFQWVSWNFTCALTPDSAHPSPAVWM